MLRGCELLEEKPVVEHLSSIVCQTASGRFAHDVAKGHALVFGVAHQLIEVIDIGLEVFAVMAGEGLLAHHRCQVSELIIQLRQMKWINFHIDQGC